MSMVGEFIRASDRGGGLASGMIDPEADFGCQDVQFNDQYIV